MLLHLLTTALVLWAPPSGAAASKRQQALDVPDTLFEPRKPDKESASSTTTPEPELPLYQPAMINIRDILGSPLTTMAAPYAEPVGMDYEHRKVYKIRGDYDIRMRTIDKIAKERRRAQEERKKKAQRGGAKPRAEQDEEASIDEEDTNFHTRPRRPGVKGRPESRGRGPWKPEFEPGRRPGRRRNPSSKPPLLDPVFHPDFPRPPETPPMKPGSERRGRGGLRKSGRRRTPAPKVSGSTQYPPGRPDFSDGRPALSTEVRNGVKIVSEPGVRPQPASNPSPASETPAPATLPGKGTKREDEQSKDDLLSSRLVEALDQEPLLPYDKVVEEDTTEATDVRRLVQESPFNFKLRELEEQQDMVQDNMFLDERAEPDPGLSAVEDNEKEGVEEDSNVHVGGKRPANGSRPESARERNATSESDMMVEIEDLGFVVGPRNNGSYWSSPRQNNRLVPVVEDSYDTDDLVNSTTNATSAGGRGIEQGTTEDDITNLSRTAAKFKRKKYSIASRVRLANDSLNTTKSNGTVGTRTRLRTRSSNKTIASPVELVYDPLNTAKGNNTVGTRTRLRTLSTNNTNASPDRHINDSLNIAKGSAPAKRRTRTKTRSTSKTITSPVRLFNDSSNTMSSNIALQTRTRLRTLPANKTSDSLFRLTNDSLNAANANGTVETRRRRMKQPTNKTISLPGRLVNDSSHTVSSNVRVKTSTRLRTWSANKTNDSLFRLNNDSLDTANVNGTIKRRTRHRARFTNKTIASPVRVVNDSIIIMNVNGTVEPGTKTRTRFTSKTIPPPVRHVNDSLNTVAGNVTVETRTRHTTRSANKTRSAGKKNAAPDLTTSATSPPRLARGGKNAGNTPKVRRRKIKSGTIPTTNRTKSLGNTNESEPLASHISEKLDNCTLPLPKSHPPLTHQMDTNELLSKWKYFGEKVAPGLPNATTTPQEFNKTVSAIRGFMREHNVSHQSMDSDFFRKSRILSGIFAPSKKGVSINFFFYTRNDSTNAIALQNDMASLQAVPVNTDTKLQVIFHDFGQGASECWIKRLKDALLNEDKRNMVLVVGWRRAASRNYWTAAANARPVGRRLASLLGRLRNERGLPLRSVHLVGLGLGAHVARHAAVVIIHRLCEKVGRVTGLDVSAPLFEEFGETLNADVAEYVDLIHTSTDFVHGLRGQVAATGHADYYTGGVLSSSDCPEARNDIRRDCDRILSAKLFLSSVRGDCAYRSTSCAPWSGRGECSGCGPRGCGRMGFRSPSANGTGAQFLHTQNREPYCDVKAILAG